MNDVATYARALREIYSLDKFGSNLGLERMHAILQKLGEPQKRYRCVLVAGSNGKGSTTEMIGAILQADGMKTGTYFSPQVEEFPERIRVGGKNAGRHEIAAAYDEVRAAADSVAPRATFFEVVTAMALLVFAKRGADVAVLEAGLGGRLDATNAVEPEVSAITSISLEHTDVLGKTVGAIAREKCGIARKGKMLVCGELGKEAKRAVRKEGKRIGTAVKFASPVRAVVAAPGEFQRKNAAVAAEVCRAMGASAGAIGRGLGSCVPKFRLEMRGNVLLDCAHNPEAAAALANEVARVKVRGKKVLLFSAMKDKDYASVLGMLAPEFDEVIITEVKLARGERAERLAFAARKAGANAAAGRAHAKGGRAPGWTVAVAREARKALALAKRRAGKGGLCTVAGSIYLLAELYGKDRIKIRLAQ
ncbi:MAG: Mur ligase family protein [Candidatus Micrarchaeia archaeon]